MHVVKWVGLYGRRKVLDSVSLHILCSWRWRLRLNGLESEGKDKSPTESYFAEMMMMMMRWPIEGTRRLQFWDSEDMMRVVWVLLLVAAVSGRSIPEARRALLQDYPMGEMQVSPPKSSFFERKGVYLVGSGCTVLLIVTISVAAVLYLRRKRRMAAVSPYWRAGMSGQLGAFETTVPLLGREEVETACEDFSNIIDDSSLDSVVYKGTLSNGTEIAALSLQKHTATWEPQRELAFRSNVKALARMNHPHLVNLIGYCSQEEPWTRIFVFEYASNGTLYETLHNKDAKLQEGEQLAWTARMRVIVGAAYGLRYMHHEICPPVPHAGFGADAVFLTDDYAGKVSNYATTTTLAPRAGTTPRSTSWFSLRSVPAQDDADEHNLAELNRNVQSFGVFLLEVITGRPPLDEQGASLVDWAAEYLGDPKMMWYTCDPSLKSHNHDELVALCKIANLCFSDQKPSMAEITEMLTDVLRLSPDTVAAKSTAALWAQLDLQDDSASSEMSG